jgi:hypothetical protein
LPPLEKFKLFLKVSKRFLPRRRVPCEAIERESRPTERGDSTATADSQAITKPERTMKNKRTEIAIETARAIVISGRSRVIAWCAECNKEVNLVTVEEAAGLAAGISRDVGDLIGAAENLPHAKPEKET